jgi:hypothetical protein
MLVTWKRSNPSYITAGVFAFHTKLKTRIKNFFGNVPKDTNGGHLPRVFFIQKVGARFALGIRL